MGALRAAPSPATSIPAPEVESARMVPKRNTALISLPSSRPDRPRWDTWRGTTIHPPSEDEVSLGNDEFGMPEDRVEQVLFKRRLIATARNLQRKQEQLKADQDLLADRWTKILATEKYGLERPNKRHMRHNWLPQPKQENQRHTTRRPHTTTVQDSKKDSQRGILKPQCNGHKCQVREVGAKYSNPQSGQRTKNSSSLFGPNQKLDQPCEIHGTPRRTAKHTNRECRIFKTKQPVMCRKQ